MVQEENNVREEIALRIWRETLTNKGNIAKWTGLSYEQVCRLVRGVRRLEGCWGDLSSVMDEEQEAFERGRTPCPRAARTENRRGEPRRRKIQIDKGEKFFAACLVQLLSFWTRVQGAISD